MNKGTTIHKGKHKDKKGILKYPKKPVKKTTEKKESE